MTWGRGVAGVWGSWRRPRRGVLVPEVEGTGLSLTELLPYTKRETKPNKKDEPRGRRHSKQEGSVWVIEVGMNRERERERESEREKAREIEREKERESSRKMEDEMQ